MIKDNKPAGKVIMISRRGRGWFRFSTCVSLGATIGPTSSIGHRLAFAGIVKPRDMKSLLLPNGFVESWVVKRLLMLVLFSIFRRLFRSPCSCSTFAVSEAVDAFLMPLPLLDSRIEDGVVVVIGFDDTIDRSFEASVVPSVSIALLESASELFFLRFLLAPGAFLRE